MTQRKTLLFYCQHSLGMGHLIRSFSLARSLSQHFHVIFLNGGPLPQNIEPPEQITIIDLPPLGMSNDKQLLSRHHVYTVSEAKAIRRQRILQTLHQSQADVVLIELFPFGRKKFAFELLPLLKAIHKQKIHPQVVCSVRDILVNDRKDQQRHDDRARWLVDRYFDAVLVHADPQFARLEESFKPRKALAKPVYYTGFVTPDKPPRYGRNDFAPLVVSVGGGLVGMPLLQTAIAAHQLLWPKIQLPFTLVAGPFLPEAEWQRLQAMATALPSITLYRSVPDLTRLIAEARASLSQCGYNTAMDLILTGTPALVVPFTEGREDEQLNRALRLQQLGLVHLLMQQQLTPERLAEKIYELLTFQPSNTDSFAIDGAQQTASLINEFTGIRSDNKPAVPPMFERVTS